MCFYKQVQFLFMLTFLFNFINGQRRQPNIVFVFADDLGYHDVGYHGSEIKTPNIDRLSSGGVRLENYYVQPVCTPTRSQFMTGRYQIHTGLQHGVIRPSQANALPRNSPTIAEKFQEVGYSTHAIGKWHLGFYKEKFLPTNRGFDSFYGYLTGAEDYFDHYRCFDYCGYDLHDNDKNIFNGTGQYSTHLFTEKAIDVIRNHDQRKPLFLYLSYQAVHSPLQVPRSYIRQYDHFTDKNRRIYAGMVSCLDGNIQLEGETHPYVQAVNELSELWFNRGRNPFLYPDFIYYNTKNGKRFAEQCDYVHSVSEDIIEKRRQTLEREGPTKKRYLDFLDILLTARDETGVGLSQLEIRNEVDTFLFEGHDTTASAISWILYSLAQHPQYQQNVRDEVDDILNSKQGDNLEWGDLNKLDYLSRVIKEGMRLHCPVPFAQRQLTQDTELDGHVIPEGTACSIHLINLHHNPLIWSDPWEFQPDRFLPQNTTGRDSYAFVPFSAGPRNCIGQHFALNEEKILISRIVQRYELKVDPNHVVRRKTAAVMRSETGIKLTATRRH
ncbi:cytochrome P450 4F6 [Patella vulgata]|uniref:cytochrome P450 4F6 n=1 Tax=Patella vulgata TaxID=6465 RepID=UPI0024A8AF7A|nr:cytochrome P450 4F6 [Patella vulgata]